MKHTLKSARLALLGGLFMAVVACNQSTPNPTPDPVTPTVPVIDSFSGTPNPSPQNVGVTFNWSVYDLDQDALTCKLDVNNDGTFEYTIAPCTSASRQLHVYTGLGLFTAKLEVTDNDANVVTRTTNIEIVRPAENRPPTIFAFQFGATLLPRVSPAASGPQTARLFWEVFDYDFDVVTCELDIGDDGSVEYVITPCNNNSQDHTFPGPGTYRAKLTAMDGKGGVASRIIEITVPIETNRPPVINEFDASYNYYYYYYYYYYPQPGQAKRPTFSVEPVVPSDASPQTAPGFRYSWNIGDPDGDPLTCRLDFDGNGTVDQTINNCPNSGQVISSIGFFGDTARLTIRDPSGASDTATTCVIYCGNDD